MLPLDTQAPLKEMGALDVGIASLFNGVFLGELSVCATFVRSSAPATAASDGRALLELSPAEIRCTISKPLSLQRSAWST
jgi:hypothetical protein